MNRFIYILIACMTVSCVDVIDAVQEEETVEVRVGLRLEDALSLDCTASASIDTKAVIDPEVSDATSLSDIISNLWIIQFNGTSDNAVLVGEPVHVSDIDDFMLPISEGGQEGRVKLTASGTTNLIVIFANVSEFKKADFPFGMSLSELKSKFKTVTDHENFLSESGGNRKVVFCGSSQSVIAQGVDVACTLKRNVAKASIRLVNQSDDLTIVSYQMHSVPSVSCYFTGYELPEIYPDVNGLDKVSYPEVVTSLSEGQSEERVFYLPVNKKGIEAGVTNEALKNRYAPDGATYLQVNAVAKSDGARLAYRFYLGADMLSDYNILPNVSYSYVFTISSRGDAEFDSRVENELLVNFANTNDEVANCYIIHPASKDGRLRKFRIPVKRVDEFWGGKAGYENVPANTLGSAGQWSVEVLVADFDRSLLNLTVSSGEGSYDAETGDLKYFEFEVAEDTEGNAVVGLRKGTGQILWSWHLWITDYAPEDAYEHTPQSGVYAYEVSGNGAVHRYEGAIWNMAGEYAGRFIMDRNLGALDTGFSGLGNGTLYYQYGRKDPFFGSEATGYSSFSRIRYADIPADGSDTYTVRYAVNNPLKYIETGRKALTKNNKYNPETFDASIVWQDPYTSGTNYVSTALDKSIFDPCPPGYCIPKSDAWSDFNANTSSNPSTNLSSSDVLSRGFKDFRLVKGMCYWPYPRSGGDASVPDNVVYYPAVGYMENGGVSTSLLGMLFYGHTSTSLNIDEVKGLKYGFEGPGPYLSTVYPLGKNLGMPIRCITSRDTD